jgi:hypothetical protein
MLKRILAGLGLALIPGWYIYRTLSDHTSPRLSWNDVFKTETDILRDELAATKKQDKEEIAKLQEAATDRAARLATASEIRSCLELTARVRTDFEALVAEEKKWDVSVEPLLHTHAGAAIAGNEDYVRAFKEFHQDIDSEDSLKAIAAQIDGTQKTCEQYTVTGVYQLSMYSQRQDLGELQKRLQTKVAQLIDARKKIEVLSQLANGQAPQTVEAAIVRQRIRDLVENYKWERERVRMYGHL